jgi:hypothetical protein
VRVSFRTAELGTDSQCLQEAVPLVSSSNAPPRPHNTRGETEISQHDRGPPAEPITLIVNPPRSDALNSELEAVGEETKADYKVMLVTVIKKMSGRRRESEGGIDAEAVEVDGRTRTTWRCRRYNALIIAVPALCTA